MKLDEFSFGSKTSHCGKVDLLIWGSDGTSNKLLPYKLRFIKITPYIYLLEPGHLFTLNMIDIS